MSFQELPPTQIKRFHQKINEFRLLKRPYPIQIHKIATVQEDSSNVPAGDLCRKLRPKARSGHRSVYLDGHMYVFGGYNSALTVDEPGLANDPSWRDSCPIFRDLWVYSFARKIWRRIPMMGPVPDACVSYGFFKKAGFLFVFGGSGKDFGLSSSNTLSMFDLSASTWSDVPVTGDPPTEMYGQGVTVHGNIMYVIGGTTGVDFSCDVHQLDLKTLVWKRLWMTFQDGPDVYQPEPRYRLEIVYYEGKLWVFGGGTVDEAYDLQGIPVFIIDEKKWVRVESLPDPVTGRYPVSRRSHSLVERGEYVYICGGCNSDGIKFSMIWRFHLKTLVWSELKSALPFGVYFHSACISPEGKMYVFGGVKEEGKTTENPRSDAIFSTWVDVPSLRDMCWEVLTETFSYSLSEKSRSGLIADGIPRDLVDQYCPLPKNPPIG